MALFDTSSPSTLQDVLGQQADTKIAGIEDSYTQQKKRLVAQQASSGRLLSPTSNYNFGDLAAGETSDIGNVYSGLSEALGAIPAEDQLNMNGFNQNLDLASLIGSLNKPSDLEQALGVLNAASTSAAGARAYK